MPISGYKELLGLNLWYITNNQFPHWHLKQSRLNNSRCSIKSNELIPWSSGMLGPLI